MTANRPDLSPDDRGAAGAASPAVDDASLVEGSHPMSSYPANPRKQLVLGVAAAIFAITLFLPWWDAEIPLHRVADTLNGWLLLATGLSIGSLGANSTYNWFGNALFGLLPVLPVLVLVTLLALRVFRMLVTPANALFLYSLLSAAGSLWLILFGVLRINAANGAYPVMAGPWIVLVASLALCALCLAWWRTERAHFPRRKWLGFGPMAVATAGPNAEAAGARGDADDLFGGFDEAVDGEDAPLSLHGGLEVGDEEAPVADHGGRGAQGNAAR